MKYPTIRNSFCLIKYEMQFNTVAVVLPRNDCELIVPQIISYLL